MGASMPPKQFSLPNALRPYDGGVPIADTATPRPLNSNVNLTPLNPDFFNSLIPTVTPPQNGANGTVTNRSKYYANGGGGNNGYKNPFDDNDMN